MLPVSTTYDNIIANGGHYEWRVYNNGTTFGMEHIVSGSIQYQGWNKQTIGNVISAQLNLTLWNVTIDTNYPIYMQFRATDGTNNSPWYAQSGFFVDTMQTNPYTQMTEITAFDALLKSETDYMPNGSFVPITAKDLADQIATDIGLTVSAETRNWLNTHPYTFSVAPNVGVGGTTDKEMLSYIATIYGANWVVRGNNIVLMYPQYTPNNTANVGNAVARLKRSDTETVKRVKLWLDYETYFLAPQQVDEATWLALGGRCIEARLPFYATQAIADRIASEYGIGGTTRSFIPYEADKVYIDPKYEVGDGVTFATDALSFTSRIASMTINIDPLSASKLEFEAEDTLNSLYPYITKVERDMIYQIGQTQAEVANANSREQIIYISKVSGTNTVTANTTWVTNATGNQNTWTTTRPVYDSSYPVLFVATQRQSVEQASGTTCSCTTPVKDQTTTVIDGGHITTGTIDASVVNVTNLNADNIDTGTLSGITITSTGSYGSGIQGTTTITAGSVTSVGTGNGESYKGIFEATGISLADNSDPSDVWKVDHLPDMSQWSGGGKVTQVSPTGINTQLLRVNGDTETFGGVTINTSTAYGNLNFKKDTDDNRGLSVSTVTWTNSNQMYFNEFHRANDVNNSYVDQYWLPESGTDNANHTYNILTTKTGIPSSYDTASSLSDINTKLLAVFNSMSNGEIKYVRINPSQSISPFGGAQFTATIYRMGTGYGAIETISYQNASGAVKHSASIYNGAITGWV